MRRCITWVALAGSVLAGSGCFDGDSEPAAAPAEAALRGGTLRVATEFPMSGGFDPVTESSIAAFELYRCCLLRTLMSYPGVPTAEGGARVRPDLADRAPTVSRDGLTWTFTLRRGLRYAPPHADTPIRSEDFARALERLARAEDSYFAQYFRVIEGFAAFAAGGSDSISGLERPDDRTLRVRLTDPAGDLGDRFALAVTAPVPAEARGWRTAGEYGPFLATSGPYMVAAAGEGRPERWRAGGRPVRLVRNPSWRRSSDPLRPAYVDRIDVLIGTSTGERLAATGLAKRVDAGELDIVIDGSTPERLLAAIARDRSGDRGSTRTRWTASSPSS
jgi:peptide/nickel transport system substrate-binding protein